MQFKRYKYQLGNFNWCVEFVLLIYKIKYYYHNYTCLLCNHSKSWYGTHILYYSVSSVHVFSNCHKWINDTSKQVISVTVPWHYRFKPGMNFLNASYQAAVLLMMRCVASEPLCCQFLTSLALWLLTTNWNGRLCMRTCLPVIPGEPPAF